MLNKITMKEFLERKEVLVAMYSAFADTFAEATDEQWLTRVNETIEEINKTARDMGLANC